MQILKFYTLQNICHYITLKVTKMVNGLEVPLNLIQYFSNSNSNNLFWHLVSQTEQKTTINRRTINFKRPDCMKRPHCRYTGFILTSFFGREKSELVENDKLRNTHTNT